MASPVSVAPWDPFEHPYCENCKGLSRPMRPPKVGCSCPLVQLELSKPLAFEKHVMQMWRQAGIPRDLFAALVLGFANPAAFWKLFKSRSLKKHTHTQLRAIEAARREGSLVHVTYNIGQLGARWDRTVTRRAHVESNPDVAALAALITLNARVVRKQAPPLYPIAHPSEYRRKRRRKK